MKACLAHNLLGTLIRVIRLVNELSSLVSPNLTSNSALQQGWKAFHRLKQYFRCFRTSQNMSAERCYIPRNTNCWRWKSGPIWTSFGSIHCQKWLLFHSHCVSLTIPRFSYSGSDSGGPWIQYQVPPSHKYPSSRTVCHICRNFKTSSKTGKQARTRNSAVRKLALLQFHVSIRPTFGETVIVILTV